ncbi:hypothetical protein MGWOODY_Tha1373 [hydrothermal vent metagenome]|uniref:Uncharacterized protein n=1 Tax=hydrothermal vent metagenome TaxID=652676 RepID=A0A160TDL3_9ZZZZ
MSAFCVLAFFLCPRVTVGLAGVFESLVATGFGFIGMVF